MSESATIVPIEAIGALVDDKAYWRERVPRWLSTKGFRIQPFTHYRELEARLAAGDSYAFVLGDFRMLGDCRTGVEYLRELTGRFPGRLGAVFIFTVRTEEELQRQCAVLEIPMTFEYLYKGAQTGEWEARLRGVGGEGVSSCI